MPNKKRKTGDYECSCYYRSPSHKTKEDCKASRRAYANREISRKLFLGSPIVLVVCGKSGTSSQSFHVHQNLLTVHSQYFRRKVDEALDSVDFKICLPDVRPALFASYISWIQSGFTTRSFSVDIKDQCEAQWRLGEILEDERFQNGCMEDLRECVTREGWPSIEDAKLIYDITDKGSLLRKFVSDVLACKNPLRSDDLDEREKWDALLVSLPDLSMDIHRAGARNWNGTKAWDSEHRLSYMVPETSLAIRWEQQILAKRTRDEIKIAADGGDLLSQIQLEHLDRKVEDDE
ncbi:hypothetical protein LSUE1_G005935 [Lachnellula suecica]|uniref:BTB domain-containing protein n=1 Tax=Lachnellula suecica TaxID=602035 RepID=A0A8T9C3F1_9HELO|nr:hypothetical protein LSUE1_G005935 [Lachnellula suecica]